MKFGAVSRAAIGAILVVSVSSACGGSGESAVPSDPLAAKGKLLADASCLGCHTTDGKSGSGPTWKGLAGSQVKLSDDSEVTADDTYLQKAIQDPSGDIVAGYPSTMVFSVPKGSVSDDDAKAIIAYIKFLGS